MSKATGELKFLLEMAFSLTRSSSEESDSEESDLEIP